MPELNKQQISIIKNGTKEEVLLLIKNAPDVNAIDMDGMTMLMHLFEREFYDEAEELVKYGADINAKDKDGNTLLHNILELNNLDQANILVKYGADLNIKDKRGNTILNDAVIYDGKDQVEFLIKHGADVNAMDTYGDTPLNLAIRHGGKDKVALLIKHGADANIKDKNGNTPLHNAIRHGSKYKIALLIENGADVNVKDKNGDTPLNLAIRHGSKDKVALLIENGAGVNVKDKNGNTPLHNAIRFGSKYTVALLIENGADVNVKDKNGNTPLHNATIHGGKDKIALLIKHGADVNVKDKNGNTPLHNAIRSGSKYKVELLIKHGADVNVKDKNGDTPLILVIKYQDPSCLQLFPIKIIEKQKKEENWLSDFTLNYFFQNLSQINILDRFIWPEITYSSQNFNQRYTLDAMIAYLQMQLQENPNEYSEKHIKSMISDLKHGHCFGFTTLWGEGMMKGSENIFAELFKPLITWDQQTITPEIKKSFEKAISVTRFSQSNRLNEQDLHWLNITNAEKYSLTQKPNFKSHTTFQLEYILDSNQVVLDHKIKKLELSRETIDFYLEALHNQDNSYFLSLSANKHNIGLYFKPNEISLFDSNYPFAFHNDGNNILSQKFKSQESPLNYTEISEEVLNRLYYSFGHNTEDTITFWAGLMSHNKSSHLPGVHESFNQTSPEPFDKASAFVANALALLLCYKILKSLVNCRYTSEPIIEKDENYWVNKVEKSNKNKDFRSIVDQKTK